MVQELHMGEVMKDDETLHSDVLNYFTAEFHALQERLRTGELDDYRERVLVSQKITEALHLLSPYVRSDPRARHLVRSADVLKKQLLSVRDIIAKKLSQPKEQRQLLHALARRRRGGIPDGMLN
jgi:hypothetical protein